MSKEHIKYALLLAQAFLVILLLVLYHKDRITLSLPVFVTLSILVGLGAYYRPRWAFWFFIGLIPLEAISLTTHTLPIDLRPYQWLGFLAGCGAATNILIGRGRLSFPQITIFDLSVFLLPMGAFIAATLTPLDGAIAFTQAIILTSFVILYFISRIFLTKLTHLRMPAKFLLITSSLIIGYSYLQNILFFAGRDANAIMPGRPNATFTETDWYGMFLTIIISLLSTLFLYISSRRPSQERTRHLYAIEISLPIVCGALIMTVARSAWLGALATFSIIVITLVLQKSWPQLLRYGVLIGLSVVFALLAVLGGGLTRFDLSDRAASTASGLQEITIACDPLFLCGNSACKIPDQIVSIAELSAIGCAHIDLEEIDEMQGQGSTIATLQRPDPNVTARKNIFHLSWQTIKAHPLTGIGWGNSGSILGSDDNGNALNSSNIFLQAWLGSGILGLMGLLSVTGLLVHRGMSLILGNAPTSKRYFYGLFILAAGAALLTANLFNAGLLLGFFWLFFATTQIALPKKK